MVRTVDRTLGHLIAPRTTHDLLREYEIPKEIAEAIVGTTRCRELRISESNFSFQKDLIAKLNNETLWFFFIETKKKKQSVHNLCS